MLHLLLSFAVLVTLGAPIAFSLAGAGLFTLLFAEGLSPRAIIALLPQRVFAGADSFALLAIPMFVFAGALMEESGASEKLVDFISALVGRVRGGLGLVAIVTSMFFAGVSGSAVADTAAVGSVLIPAMKRRGYEDEFAAALQASAGSVGPVIPPSILMVVYAVIASTSVGKLFLGGFIPGVLMGLSMIAVVMLAARLKGYPREAGVSLREMLRRFWRALLPLVMPIIVLGGIFSGAFTATESAAVAAVYSAILAVLVYRALPAAEIPRVALKAGLDTARVMFVIVVANFVGWILARERVPETVVNTVLSVTDNRYVILLLFNIVLLIVGCLMEASAALVILVPIALPLMTKLGVDPIHLGVLMVTNLCIGTITPPVGVSLYVASSIAKVPFIRIAKASLPFLAALVVVQFLITYVPWLVMFLPSL